MPHLFKLPMVKSILFRSHKMVQQRKWHLLFATPREILFGLETKNYHQGANKSLIKFNFTLLFAKYYLYTQKLLKKEISMKEFIRKLTSKLQTETLS